MDSLFYVKTKISDECEINTAVSCDNVYMRCAGCGVEEQVDLTDWTNLIAEQGIDCIGTQIYCEECSKKRTTGSNINGEKYSEEQDNDLQ